VEEKRMKSETRAVEAGFSLIELMMAMLITLIISGAIYGLMATGQGAFRREPELADRQQNIRVAMDLVQRDIGNAGAKIFRWRQIFTNGLNGLGPPVPTGGNADILEVFGNDGTCPDVFADPGNPTNGANLNTISPIPNCYPEPGMILVLYPGGVTKWGWGHNIHSSGNDKVNFPPGQQPNGPPPLPVSEIQSVADLGAPVPVGMALMQFVRYEIGIANGIPNLYRTVTGGLDTTGAYVAPTAAGATTCPAPCWQLVARGVENLQVQYMNGNGAWADNPGAVLQDNYTTIVRQVRVTLTARNTGVRNLQGAGIGAAASMFVRGDLTSVNAPRAALDVLSTASPAPIWR